MFAALIVAPAGQFCIADIIERKLSVKRYTVNSGEIHQDVSLSIPLPKQTRTESSFAVSPHSQNTKHNPFIALASPNPEAGRFAILVSVPDSDETVLYLFQSQPLKLTRRIDARRLSIRALAWKATDRLVAYKLTDPSSGLFDSFELVVTGSGGFKRVGTGSPPGQSVDSAEKNVILNALRENRIWIGETWPYDRVSGPRMPLPKFIDWRGESLVVYGTSGEGSQAQFHSISTKGLRPMRSFQAKHAGCRFIQAWRGMEVVGTGVEKPFVEGYSEQLKELWVVPGAQFVGL